MKKSELTIVTGERHRLTPYAWGDRSIMVDEDAVTESTREAFGLDEAPDPDSDQNDKPEWVQVYRDANGQHYAVTDADVRRDAYRKTEIPEYWAKCDDPTQPDQYGSVWVAQSWSSFDDEEE